MTKVTGALAALLAASSLSGAAFAQTELSLWYHGAGNEAERNILEGIVADFNAAQGDWKVAIEQFPQVGYNDSVTAAALSGKLPDILDVDGPIMPNWAWAGYLAPLTIDPAKLEGFLPGVIGRWNDQVYSVGFWDAALAMFARKSVLEENGIRIPTLEAMTLADKIVVLRAGEVMQVGTPLELYHNPANQFVAGFLGSPKMNFLDVEVKEAGNGAVTVASPALEPVRIPHAVGRFAAGGRAVLGVRPQFLHPGAAADRGHLHGRVALVERLGTETVVNLELTSGGRIVVALDGDQAFDLGAEMLLGFEPDKAHLFEAA